MENLWHDLRHAARNLRHNPGCSGSGSNFQVEGMPDNYRPRSNIRAELPLYNPRTLQQVVDDSVVQPRFISLLSGLFAGLALLLATIGVYGVVSYSVNQRLREIGVRLALGAERRGILGLVLRRGMTLVMAGSAFGLVVAFFASRVLRSMVYEVSPTDLATFTAVTLILGFVGAVACLIPALRRPGSIRRWYCAKSEQLGRGARGRRRDHPGLENRVT